VKGEKYMWFLVILGLVAAFAFLSAYFGRKVQGNAGKNIGEKYMKEHWGMEAEERRED
jgi:hypothetical protein